MKAQLGIRIGIFAGAMIVLLYGVFQIVQRPVGGDSDHYSAIFTDANGLRAGDDVRLFGVRIGKVGGISLDGTDAKVDFIIARSHTLYRNTMLAIRYQNLSGQRYLDVQQGQAPAQRLRPGTTIGTDHTTPAFDITTLFNGLQPVLAELSPADLNQFTQSMLAVIEGDGSGLGPALGAIEKLSQYATDRQAVISLLVRNMAAVAEKLGGRSGNAMTMLSKLTDLFATFQDKTEDLVDFGVTIPPVLEPAVDLLHTIGMDGDPNSNLDRLIKTAFPEPQRALDTLGRLPGLLQSLSALIPGRNVVTTCSHGATTAPQPLRVLIAGQRITLCNG